MAGLLIFHSIIAAMSSGQLKGRAKQRAVFLPYQKKRRIAHASVKENGIGCPSIGHFSVPFTSVTDVEPTVCSEV